MQGQI